MAARSSQTGAEPKTRLSDRRSKELSGKPGEGRRRFGLLRKDPLLPPTSSPVSYSTDEPGKNSQMRPTARVMSNRIIDRFLDML